MNSNTQRALGAGHRPVTVCERLANVVVPALLFIEEIDSFRVTIDIVGQWIYCSRHRPWTGSQSLYAKSTVICDRGTNVEIV